MSVKMVDTNVRGKESHVSCGISLADDVEEILGVLDLRNFFFIFKSINLRSVPRMGVTSEDASSDALPESLISPSEAETDAAELEEVGIPFNAPDVNGTEGIPCFRSSTSWAANVNGEEEKDFF